MLFDSLVDSIILPALHWEDHVATLGVREADVLAVLGVSGPGEADGGDAVHQDAGHVEDVLVVFQYWLEVVGGPHVHDEVTAIRFHPAYDGISLSHIGVVREPDSCPLVYVVRISGGNREVHPVSVLVIFPSSHVLTVLRSGSTLSWIFFIFLSFYFFIVKPASSWIFPFSSTEIQARLIIETQFDFVIEID